MHNASTRPFLTFHHSFLLLLLLQKTLTTVHTTDHALKFFPRHMTGCHPWTSWTWEHTWSKSCMQAYSLLALLSCHHRVEHSGGLCLSVWHVFCIHSCMSTPYPQWLQLSPRRLSVFSRARRNFIYWSNPPVSVQPYRFNQSSMKHHNRDQNHWPEGSWKPNIN